VGSIANSENLAHYAMISQDSTTNTNSVQPLEEHIPYIEDWDFNNTIWDEDDERIRKIKWIIKYKLSPGERDLIILYTHNNSNYHTMARLLGCSVTTCRNKICQIRNKIIDNL